MPIELDDLDESGASIAARDGELLRVLAESSKARSVVEVQALLDQAELLELIPEPTRVLCEAAAKTGGTFTCIVPGGEPAVTHAAALAALLEAAGLPPARFVTGDLSQQLAALPAPADLLYLAGDIDYIAAFHAALPNLRPGSMVVAARTDKAFLDTIQADPGFETTLLDKGGGLSVSLQKR